MASDASSTRVAGPTSAPPFVDLVAAQLGGRRPRGGIRSGARPLRHQRSTRACGSRAMASGETKHG